MSAVRVVPVRFTARAWRLAGVVALGAVLAACGGAASTSGAGGSGGSSATSPEASAATVTTHSGDLGTYLTDGSGKTLYLWDADKMNKSTCTGQCLAFWPPLLAKDRPTASGEATAGLLGTIDTSQGKQVTYAGHPLYYYASDSAPGDVNGQGNDDLGPKWWVVAPSGSSITTAAGGSAPSESSSGGAGGGWA